ncbi:MAG: hypothetical protein QOI08_4239, partial [Actinomycetota bacterium]|nr:hypothetical protein [Actinomycetota bacterium]
MLLDEIGEPLGGVAPSERVRGPAHVRQAVGIAQKIGDCTVEVRCVAAVV